MAIKVRKGPAPVDDQYVESQVHTIARIIGAYDCKLRAGIAGVLTYETDMLADILYEAGMSYGASRQAVQLACDVRAGIKTLV